MDTLIWCGKLLWFLLPVAIANMSPVLFKNRFTVLAKPIHAFVFGDHKTWRGIVVATLSGGIVFAIQKTLAYWNDFFIDISAYNPLEFPWWFGLFFGFGAIMGDLIKSFLKRRLHITPGSPWVPFDQIDFLVGGLLVLLLFKPIELRSWVLILTLGTFVHWLINRIAYQLKLKEHPW